MRYATSRFEWICGTTDVEPLRVLCDPLVDLFHVSLLPDTIATTLVNVAGLREIDAPLNRH